MTMFLYANNASDTLNGAITNVATTVILNDASEFKAIGAGEQYYLTITDGANIEIMLATALSTNTFTVTRGQQGTSGTAFADGTLVEQRITQGDLDNFVQRAEVGDIDFSGASSLKIPSDAAPTVDAAGKFALDTTITDHTGLTKYHDGTEELTHIAVPTPNLTTTNGKFLKYNATANEFDFSHPDQDILFRVYRATNITLTTATLTKISYDTENYDIGGDFDSATNYYFTAPQAGTYRFCAMTRIGGLASGNVVEAQFIKNGSTVLAIGSDSAGGSLAPLIIYTEVELAASDTVEVQAAQYSGSNKDITGGDAQAFFCGGLVR